MLAVFAQPADEALGPAGALAKYSSEGVTVSLVTVSRESAPTLEMAETLPREEPATRLASEPREIVCACRTLGVRRMCLPESRPGADARLLLEERLVRVLREVRPQVIVTHAFDASVAEATRRAFCSASDPSQFVSHFREGLMTWAPQKLYHAVVPESILEQWHVHGITGVPDSQVTTVLDVSAYAESKRKALYCNRNHVVDYVRWLAEEKHANLDREYFVLVQSSLGHRTRREDDLFAGLR